ncbi:MAG TPA: hypothetical protein VGD23_10170 [Sphingomicrobium sp.]
MQTGASALLAAASVATLYSVVHFFDLFRKNPTADVEPQRIEFEPPVAAEFALDRQEGRAPLAAIEPRLVIDNVVEDAQAVDQVPPVDEEAAPSAKSGRRAKTPRKSTARAKAPASAKGVEQPASETEIEKPALSDVAEVVEPEPHEEPFHSPVAPLFEPEPFVRQQQRAMFGRKAG